MPFLSCQDYNFPLFCAAPLYLPPPPPTGRDDEWRWSVMQSAIHWIEHNLLALTSREMQKKRKKISKVDRVPRERRGCWSSNRVKGKISLFLGGDFPARISEAKQWINLRWRLCLARFKVMRMIFFYSNCKWSALFLCCIEKISSSVRLSKLLA